MGKLKNLLWLTVALLAAWVGVWVVLENPDSISFTLLGYNVGASLPAGLWILTIFAGGCLVGLAAGFFPWLRLKRRVASLNKQLVKK